MRQDCRNYESRTYANGETVRKCNLDLAPNAPWECPNPCSGFEVRLDAGWTYGTLVNANEPAPVPGLADGTAAAVLDEAEDIVNSIGAQVRAELDAERANAARTSRWRRLFRRRR